MLQRPWLGYRLPARLLARWIQVAGAARRANRDGPVDAVIVGYMGHFDIVLARLLFRRPIVALDLLIFAADTAQDRGITSGPKVRALSLLDQLACRCADVVMVDTEEHAALVPAASRSKALVTPVGASRSWFAAGAAVTADRDPPLRVVFFGLFTPLQGATVVGEAIALLSDTA